MDPEMIRLQDGERWKKWGPYLSERQWGTVREDYSQNGTAWDYLTHDQSRSRAYRWGEDGLAGISDNRQLVCFALALWNGKDPILKERMFGLTNSEGNHGEDVKEYYFYLDSTPTHSYMKYLYKYPQAAYPYEDLVKTNAKRSRTDLEYELIDTGVFNDDRYFDVFVEYAKEAPEDLLIEISVANRGPETAVLDLLPTIWFRNTWSWSQGSEKPELRTDHLVWDMAPVVIAHPVMGERYLYSAGEPTLLFTENETNCARIFGQPNASPYVKDAFHRHIIERQKNAVNPALRGTKAAAHYHLEIPAGETAVVHLRLSDVAPDRLTKAYPDGDPFGAHFTETFRTRRREANQFYNSIIPSTLSGDERNVMRQAIAGMLWSKQYYDYDLDVWLDEHGADPDRGESKNLRNGQWFHMVNADILSMPDKWEYPWFAAWDLAFHTLALSLVDPDFAFDQLDLMLQERYLHPNGQLPAYEWNFSDVNPPVHAWACIFNFRLMREHKGKANYTFLKHAFHKLLMNFTWWLNRKDQAGDNLFEGGFLGLDNIGVFDRSAPLPTGGYLEQADGTAWMALFSQNMLEIALELAAADPLYEELACKFFEHFIWIASAINRCKHRGSMWDEEDGFFYDLLRLPNGDAIPMKVRSLVGLLPLCATTVFDANVAEHTPGFMARAEWFSKRHPELFKDIHRPGQPGVKGRFMLSLLNEQRLRRVLGHMLDENEFFSDYGIRSISKYHEANPYIFMAGGQEFRVDYMPAESQTGLFGGNSNWRGPIWMPTNALINRALLQLYRYYGDSFTVECPTGSGKQMNLYDVAKELSRRLANIFLRDEQGRRPVYGGATKFQTDPHWRDYILFYEYFHGDNGAGIGASHQTGWTGVIARSLQVFSSVSAEQLLEETSLTEIFSQLCQPAVA